MIRGDIPMAQRPIMPHFTKQYFLLKKLYFGSCTLLIKVDCSGVISLIELGVVDISQPAAGSLSGLRLTSPAIAL